MSSFDLRDIRRWMDVYTLDNIYLGSVLRIVPGPLATAMEEAGAAPRQSSEVSGEALGPMPTVPAGNQGPETQSAARLYGTARDAAPPIGRGFLEVGKWWGLKERRAIPMDAVQTVSLERVVLKLKRSEIV